MGQPKHLLGKAWTVTLWHFRLDLDLELSCSGTLQLLSMSLPYRREWSHPQSSIKWWGICATCSASKITPRIERLSDACNLSDSFRYNLSTTLLTTITAGPVYRNQASIIIFIPKTFPFDGNRLGATSHWPPYVSPKIRDNRFFSCILSWNILDNLTPSSSFHLALHLHQH